MKEAPNKNKYNRSRSIIIQLIDTWYVWIGSSPNSKIGFFDLFVLRWYKNFIQE